MDDSVTTRDQNRLHEVASAAFFPRADMPFGPEAAGARDHFFEVDRGIRLRLRLFPGAVDTPNILFFHGNGETARDYDTFADAYRALPASLLVAEYRGYGPSTGIPSANTFLGDAHQTLDEVRSLLAAEGRNGPLVVMGRSLGSAPAIELACSRPDQIAALIVESGFARMVPLLELIGIPARLLGITEEQGTRNQEKMGNISMPTLILHAEHDQIIPFDDAELLLAANRDPCKVLVKILNANHNDIQIQGGKNYFDAINDLLQRVG